MKTILFVVCSFFTLLSDSCLEKIADRVERIRIKNATNDTISVCYAAHYPDTSLRDELLPTIGVLFPGHESVFDKQDWSKFIDQQIPGKKLIIFVFAGAVNASINPERWPVIRDNYQVLKRYELSSRDLDSLGYIIKFQ